MDADRDAAASCSGCDDSDEGGCGGAGDLGKCNCNYAGYRYGLSCGWHDGDRHSDCELAGVYDGERAVRAERDHVCNNWSGRDVEHATGAKRRVDADGDLLYGGVPA